MTLKSDEQNFLRFLKDEKFIEWKLSPTDELNEYWEEFQQQFPDERENLLLAEAHFAHIRLSSFKVPPREKEAAVERLRQSLSAHYRMRTMRRFTYAAVACVIVFVLSTVYMVQKRAGRPGQELAVSTDYIRGSEQESEDILLITGNKTTSFRNNVDIQMNADKTARVKDERQGDTQISIGQHTRNKLIVPPGKRSKIVLADGTQVWLNSGSSLEFPSAFTGNTREVRLSGEMYIEVAPDKDKSFHVHVSDFNVKVYGTKFNVSAYSGSSPSVVLVEGSVSLQATDKQEVFISPNEQAIYSEATGAFNTRKVDVQTFLSWKDGYLTFQDTPMAEALKQIERYYNLSFNYGEGIPFQGLTCTGKIILSDNLDNVMTALTLISGTKYKKEDKLIYIYKE